MDWERAEEDLDAKGGAGRIRAFRDLQRIVELHRALQREGGEVDAPDPDPVDS